MGVEAGMGAAEVVVMGSSILALVAVLGAGGGLMEQVATAGSVAVLVMAVLLMPYSLVALRWHEDDPRIKDTHKDIHRHYGPSLFITTWLTRADFYGMAFVMAVVLARLALRYDVVGEAAPQPAWSLILNLFASLVLLGLLALPTAFLFWTKTQILNIRYTKRNDNSPPIELTGREPK